MNFGERLRQLREAAKLTQEGLARRADVSLSAISKMELKSVDPSWSTVIRLARALSVSVASFDSEEPPVPDEAQEKPKRKRK